MHTRRATWPWLALAGLCAALYLPGVAALPPVDRDEARYALAAHQMVASGDLIVPRLQDAPRLIKPIGIYWLQAVAVRLTGAPDAIGVYRLPSLLAALAAVLGTYAIGRRLFDARAACLGAAWLAASALLVVEAHLATTDAALLACIVAAQASLAILYRAARHGRDGGKAAAAGFWIALGAGTLVKGPVAALVSGLTIGALAGTDRRAVAPLWRALRVPWGIAIAAACAAPWAIAVVTAVGWRAVAGAMAGDIMPKLLGVHESHGGPPGLYAFIAPATFWPGSLVLVYALTHAWRRRARTAERFLLAWLLPTWVLFECLPTKLPHYVLPTFPALALLAGRAACTAPVRLYPRLDHPLCRAVWAGWAAFTVVAGLVLPVAAHWLRAQGTDFSTLLPALIAAAIAAASLHRVWRGQLVGAAWCGIGGAVLFYAVLLELALPRLDALWLGRNAAALIAADAGAAPVAAVGFGEPSLAFLTGARPLNGADAAAWLAEHPDGVVVVAGPEADAFLAAAHALAPRERGATTGLNYSTGTWVTLHVFERTRR